MDTFVEHYVGKRRAKQLLESPKVRDDPRLRHELFLTAVLNKLSEAAVKKDIRMGLVGSMGMAHDYDRPGARRWCNDIDLEIPNTITPMEIDELLRSAGLKPTRELKDLYTPETLISRNPYDKGKKSVDIIIGTECPDYKTFQAHSRTIGYQNHAIASLELPAIRFRQFTPAVLALSKAMALADPNRQVSAAKMGDIHDLMHILHAIDQKDIDFVVNSRMLEGLTLPRDDQNLATVIQTLREHPEPFQRWQRENLVNPRAASSLQEYRNALERIERVFDPKGYAPLTAIRTKLQLVEPSLLKTLASRFDPDAPKGQIRSGLIARALEAELRDCLNPAQIRTLSRANPQAVAKRISQQFRLR